MNMFTQYMNKLKGELPEGTTLEAEFLGDGYVMMKVTLEGYLTLDMKLNEADLGSEISLSGYNLRVLTAVSGAS